MKLKEIHSSDLTASCAKFVQLRFEGKLRPAATGALFRGLVAGEVLRYLHERFLHNGSEEPALYTPLVNEAIAEVRRTLATEGRTPTDAVETGIAETITDMCEFAEHYYRRFKDRFAQSTFLGCEVPVRWKYAKRMPEFASHIDLLIRDSNGALVFIDWKLRESAPTHAYLARNMQFACYYGCCLEGKFLLSDGLSTEWTQFGEEARGVWLHVNHVLPFGRKTTCADDFGVDREFVKGDDRPIRMAWREVTYAHSAIETIRAQLVQRVKMIKANIFPSNPDPVGCNLCEAESYCPRFDTVI